MQKHACVVVLRSHPHFGAARGPRAQTRPHQQGEHRHQGSDWGSVQ